MISFDRSRILALCLKYGPLLDVPAEIDGARLMGAIAANESSLGANCGPRHEPAYDLGGKYAPSGSIQAGLLGHYGRAAACSYGPWQLMFINAPGYTPDELESDPESCARAFLEYFNSFVVPRGGKSLEQIGQIYNGGHVTAEPSPGVKAYCLELQHNYNRLGGNPA